MQDRADAVTSVLSVPTLWIVFVVNFVALGLVWVYVARSYPNFEAARFWAVAALLAAGGAAISMLRDFMNPMIPLTIGGPMLISACGIAAMGIERFYGRALSWRIQAAIVVLGFAGMTYYAVGQPNTAARIVIYSLAQSIAIGLSLRLCLSNHDGVRKPGAYLTGVIAVLIIGINLSRAGMAYLDIGGSVSMVKFNPTQAAMVLVLLFLSMMWNFGFLLMAIDRLRAEVADLALLDDLTGVANRRQFVTCLAEECARSDRSMQPFAVLAIDLDGFKDINDSHGHGAGDECLRVFASTVQGRLRAADLLARMGGDEFCVVLPAATAREAAAVARQLLDACAEHPATWHGTTLNIGVSIGIAQWSHTGCGTPEQLMAAADQALYTAKKNGKARFAMAGESAAENPASAPEPSGSDVAASAPLLKSA